MNYASKNILVPSKESYKILLISKIENLIERMIWKALAFLGKMEKSKHRQDYGFRTRNCPVFVEELTEFECNLQLMIKNVFKNVNNTFQTQLLNDVKKIEDSDKTFIPADKSRKIYLLSKDEYQKLLLKSVTKTYKMTNRRNVYGINNEAKSIAIQLSIDNRIERIYENDSYITIKYHKEDFLSKISCRLINPSKSDVRKISKTMLDKMITKIVSLTNANQWKNSISVIEW